MTIKSIRECFVKLFFFLISVKNKLFIHTTKNEMGVLCCCCCNVVFVEITLTTLSPPWHY